MPVRGFEWAYRSGVPPWDIGRTQPAIVRLAEQGLIAGDVIDIGCGTGDNALYLASSGLGIIGVEAVPTAIAQALEKARLREQCHVPRRRRAGPREDRADVRCDDRVRPLPHVLRPRSRSL